MHILGTKCFCCIQNKTKLDPREKGIFVGYSKESLVYVIYFPETMAIKRVQCLKFPLLLMIAHYQNWIKIPNFQNT